VVWNLLSVCWLALGCWREKLKIAIKLHTSLFFFFFSWTHLRLFESVICFDDCTLWRWCLASVIVHLFSFHCEYSTMNVILASCYQQLKSWNLFRRWMVVIGGLMWSHLNNPVGRMSKIFYSSFMASFLSFLVSLPPSQQSTWNNTHDGNGWCHMLWCRRILFILPAVSDGNVDRRRRIVAAAAVRVVVIIRRWRSMAQFLAEMMTDSIWCLHSVLL
jgi:hypothetical protein